MTRTGVAVVVSLWVLSQLGSFAGEPVAADRDYLSASEAAGVTLGTITFTSLGLYTISRQADAPPRWVQPPGIDLWFARALGRQPSSHRRANFMDYDRSSFINLAVSGTIKGILDGRYPHDDRTKDIIQGQFLFYTGGLAQKGLHDMFKGTVRRQRPLAYLYPDSASPRPDFSRPRANQSFYSGHASSAFYAAVMLNKSVRHAMRREMSAAEFRDWSWVSPAVLFSWSSFVALTRVQANQHYLTDVLAGAVAGWMVAELFSYIEKQGLGEGDEKTIEVPLLYVRVLL